jgi:Putative peptidoglycan binding domain
VNGTNYLLPVDADLKSEMDVKLGAAINVDLTLEQTMADAASNPTSEVELEFWRSIKESSKPEELNAYLTSYPNGQFKSLALARIASLQDGPSTATRNLTTGIDPATFSEAADQTAEDQIGLDRGQRRDMQRRLTGLGFDTRVNGKFDEQTRAVITRWQAARGYPRTGFLNGLQLKALQSEIVATRLASVDDGDDEPSRHSSRHHDGGGGGRHYRGGGEPAAFFGGMMGGLVRR